MTPNYPQTTYLVIMFFCCLMLCSVINVCHSEIHSYFNFKNYNNLNGVGKPDATCAFAPNHYSIARYLFDSLFRKRNDAFHYNLGWVLRECIHAAGIILASRRPFLCGAAGKWVRARKPESKSYGVKMFRNVISRVLVSNVIKKV